MAVKKSMTRKQSDLALLSRVPESVRSRFREGGFCRWRKDEWLPVLELGPFDVAPGPVRDMWLEMFEKSQKQGRSMKRLVYWYGEDQGQAYSFVRATQLINFEEGRRKGSINLPKRILNKIDKQQELSKKEGKLKRGLADMEADMQRDKPERAQWMTDCKEGMEEEDARAMMESNLKSTSDKPKPTLKEEEAEMSKRKSKSPSSAIPDGIVRSGSIDIKYEASPVKRARQTKPVSSHAAIKTPIEPTTSSSIPISIGGISKTAAKMSPTSAEYHLVVHALGKLHPDVITMNDQRRALFARREKPSEESSASAAIHTGIYDDAAITDAIISTMLSQNTTAANQNRAFASLKAAFPGGWSQVANEPSLSRIEDAIRVAGLAKIRAERMQIMLQTIQRERGEANFEYLEDFHSTADIQKELGRFKGMGPKTISCVLLFALGRPDFPVDTHVLRISKQMGWVPHSFSRETAYVYLNDQIPDDCKLDLHCLLVTHGKQCHTCAARGRAQFPPTVPWVCPMAAIKNGKLVAPAAASAALVPPSIEKVVVKEETLLESTLKIEPPDSKIDHSIPDIQVKVEEVKSWCGF